MNKLLIFLGVAGPGLTEAFTDNELVRLLGLLGGGGTLLWYVMRQMVKFQKYFNNFYAEENTKLREHQKVQDQLINELRTENGQLRAELYLVQAKNAILQSRVDHLQEEIDEFRNR